MSLSMLSDSSETPSSHLSVLCDLCYRLVSRKEKNGDFLSSAQNCSSRRLRAEKPGTQPCSAGTQSLAHSSAALWARRLYLWVASLGKILIDFTISVYAHACIHAVHVCRGTAWRPEDDSQESVLSQHHGLWAWRLPDSHGKHFLSIASPGWFSNSVPHRPHVRSIYVKTNTSEVKMH